MAFQPPMIDFSLDFQYESAEQPSLSGVQGEIPRGACIVLCGGSGCGKSTLLRCLNQLIPQFYEGVRTGFCRMNGRELEEMSIGETGRLAASVFQDPRSQFFTMNSTTEVAFGLENFGVPHEELARRTEEAFTRFGLEKLKDRSVFALSSGERQLVAILSAWALQTDVLLLDEPTANLDDGAILQLRRLLEQLKREGKTLVIAEHRLSYLSGIADEYWRMEGGKIAEKLPSGRMLALTQQELRERGLRTTDPEKVLCARPLLPEKPENSLTFEAKELRFSYQKGGKPVLSGLSLQARSGEVVGLIGANGCGKTTFGKLAAGLYKPSGGQLLLNGEPLSPKALSRQSIFIMQEAEFQFFTNSVLNELRYGRKRTEALDRELESLLRRTGLWEVREHHPFSLSGGQMQKLVLLLAYLSPKPIAVLDEPTAGLDAASLQTCAALIAEMRERKLVFLITHDPELIALSCTRCIALSAGRTAEQFDLSVPKEFDRLKVWRRACPPAEGEPRGKIRQRPLLDPRTKLLLLLTSMAVGVLTDLPLMLCTFTAVLASSLYERRWVFTAVSACLMASLFVLYGLFPCTALSFVANFFPRIILIGTAVMLVIRDDEAPRTLAGLRKLHVPERAIMVCSVMFRFFPVLSADLGIMKQSIRTRGFFVTAKEKLRAIPGYLEIMIVPMVFRVIRIAEALSASAETRGIALPGRRSSLIPVAFRPADVCMTVLLAAALAAGLMR